MMHGKHGNVAPVVVVITGSCEMVVLPIHFDIGNNIPVWNGDDPAELLRAVGIFDDAALRAPGWNSSLKANIGFRVLVLKGDVILVQIAHECALTFTVLHPDVAPFRGRKELLGGKIHAFRVRTAIGGIELKCRKRLKLGKLCLHVLFGVNGKNEVRSTFEVRVEIPPLVISRRAICSQPIFPSLDFVPVQTKTIVILVRAGKCCTHRSWLCHDSPFA